MQIQKEGVLSYNIGRQKIKDDVTIYMSAKFRKVTKKRTLACDHDVGM